MYFVFQQTVWNSNEKFVAPPIHRHAERLCAHQKCLRSWPTVMRRWWMCRFRHFCSVHILFVYLFRRLRLSLSLFFFFLVVWPIVLHIKSEQWSPENFLYFALGDLLKILLPMCKCVHIIIIHFTLYVPTKEMERKKWRKKWKRGFKNVLRYAWNTTIQLHRIQSFLSSSSLVWTDAYAVSFTFFCMLQFSFEYVCVPNNNNLCLNSTFFVADKANIGDMWFTTLCNAINPYVPIFTKCCFFQYLNIVYNRSKKWNFFFKK